MFDQPVNITIHNLCVADATTIQGSGHRGSAQRYRPIISDYEIYVASENEFGGSGSYHLNAYGWRIIFAPVIRAQNWRGSRLHNVVADSIACSGDIAVHGNIRGRTGKGWVDFSDALQVASWLKVSSFISAGGSVISWGGKR